MAGPRSFLVVGGDSLVGGSLTRSIRSRGHIAIATTRRRDTLGVRRLFLDLESDTMFAAPSGVDCAFVLAAATHYDRCERDPLAHYINVELIPRLIISLLEQGLFVSFISTNSVFGGERPWPREDDSQAPGIAYARQKAEAERVVRVAAQDMKVADRLSVVRLTKILARSTAPLPSWFEAWTRDDVVRPFADLIFAPLSVQFAGNALAAFGEQRIPGDLHLSGAEDVSYVDFAFALAGAFGVDTRLIAPTTATENGVRIAFKPRFSGLSMVRTTELSGVVPQTLAGVVKDLASY